MECMCAQTRPRFLLSSKRVWGEVGGVGGGGGNGVRTHVNSKGKNPLYRKKSPQRGIEPTSLHQAGQRAELTTNKLFQPQNNYSFTTGAQHTTNELFQPPNNYSLLLLFALACLDQNYVQVPSFGATRGVMVSTSAFLVCHQCYCAGSSHAWGLNLQALVCGIF